MPIVQLRSGDGDIFEVDVEVIRCSGTIRALLDDDDLVVLPLPGITSRILKKVLEWATHHKDDHLPVKKDRDEDNDDTDDEVDNNSTGVDSWDTDFLRVDRATLFELLIGANYLKIKDLVNLTCAEIAKMITGQCPEVVRQLFDVKNDFTSTEERAIRKANSWCEIDNDDDEDDDGDKDDK